jgi:hypothetical protein
MKMTQTMVISIGGKQIIMMKFAGNLRKWTSINENRLVVFLQKTISVTIRIQEIAKKV